MLGHVQLQVFDALVAGLSCRVFKRTSMQFSEHLTAAGGTQTSYHASHKKHYSTQGSRAITQPSTS